MSGAVAATLLRRAPVAAPAAHSKAPKRPRSALTAPFTRVGVMTDPGLAVKPAASPWS